jgi:hypothetical protein
MKRICCVVLVLMVGASAGCKRSTTVTGPKGEKVTVTQKGAAIEGTATGPGGEKVRWSSGEGGVALPDDFPKDVAVYPKATVVTSTSVKKQMTATLKTADPAEKATAFYKDKLKENGWTIESTMNIGNMSMLHGVKAGRKVTVSVTKDSDQTMIVLAVDNEE